MTATTIVITPLVHVRDEPERQRKVRDAWTRQMEPFRGRVAWPSLRAIEGGRARLDAAVAAVAREMRRNV
jgi:hypothetical protein